MKPAIRIAQFLSIYLVAIGILWAVKWGVGLSDYLVPPPSELVSVLRYEGINDFMAALNTLVVAVMGHGLAVVLATLVALVGRSESWVGNVTRIAAYNLQAYPIVAVAPIIFLFLGDGLSSRLLIAAMICYFPLLLSFIGVFAQRVEDVEHFYHSTGRLGWSLELKIRTFENLDKLITVVVGSGTTAMVGTVVAEFLAATNGIGYVIRKALYQSDLAKILLALFFIGILSSLYLSLLESLGNGIKKKAIL